MLIAWLLATLVGCARKTDLQPEAAPDAAAQPRPGLLQFEQLHSAWDGQHSYSLVVSISDADTIDPASVGWQVDETYFAEDDFPELPAGRLLTIQRAGDTDIRVFASTHAGVRVTDTAHVEITEGTPKSWDVGDYAFRGELPPFPRMPPTSMVSCGAQTPSNMPRVKSDCSRCHSESAAGRNSLSTLRLEHFADDELIAIFSEARRPPDPGPDSGLPKDVLEGASDCLFKLYHTLDVAEDIKQGLVLKLRSIAP